MKFSPLVSPPQKRWPRRVLEWGLVLVFFLVVFRSFIAGNSVLLTTDAAIGHSNLSPGDVGRQILPHWFSGYLLGAPRGMATQAASLLQGVMPGVLWNNLVYGFACLLASMLFCFGYGRRLGSSAVLVGGLCAFWLGSNFTLVVAGHVFKAYVVLFFVASVLAARVPGWKGGGLWGGFTGLMFVQQPDVALFFALFGGAYLLFVLGRREGPRLRPWLAVLLPGALVSLLLAAGPLLSGYRHSVKDAAQMQVESAEAKWEYATQWSFPPDECLGFIAPGYFGWRSGEPEGPYWGRMGRSAGWEQTRQGFMNFMLESVYVGILPVAFALFALAGFRHSPHRAEILFWSAAAGVALLLAFGKFFPLYGVFYQLPMVGNIRNPNKFLQVFQVALAILSAYGVDALVRGRATSPASGVCRAFVWIMAGVSLLLGLVALRVFADQGAIAARFVGQGWPAEMARAIAGNQGRSLAHAACMGAAAAVAFAAFSFRRFASSRRLAVWVPAVLVALVALDAVALSRHYLKKMPVGYIQSNALTEYLGRNVGSQRVALLDQQGLYGVWVGYLLPFNRIPTFNFYDLPRMPLDYKRLLDAGQANPLGLWRFSSVRYFLAPAEVESQLPPGQARVVFRYSVVGRDAGDFELYADPQGPHAVFELLGSLPRFVLLADYDPALEARTLERVAGRGPLVNGRQTGAVEVVRHRPGYAELRTRSEEPALLRVADRWDPDWKAVVDGKPVEVVTVDFLCQGVVLPPGEHAVILRYAPSLLFFWMQGAGLLAVFAAAGSLLIRRKAHASAH